MSPAAGKHPPSSSPPSSNTPPSSAVFQAGGFVVVLVEVARKAHLASLVPVIVNAILSEHQIVADIVAFVNKGDFPRSRLGEKQRGKILAGWVSRKMRTIAQFAIKDMDSTVLGPPGTSGENPSPAADPHHHRDSLGSLRSAGGGPLYHPSSLRNVEPAPRITEEDYSYHNDNRMSMAPPPAPASRPAPAPAPVEMPADEESTLKQDYANRVSIAAFPHGYDLPDFEHFNDDPEEEDERPPPVGRKPDMMTTYQRVTSSGSGMGPQVRYLPGVDGRESFDGGGSGGGGVGGQGAGEEDDEWTRDAKMSMNLAGRLGRGG